MDRKRSMDELQREIQELFSDLWQVPRFSGLRAGFRPNADCYRTKDAIIVLIELPGVDTANVDIFVAEGTLYVSGERKRPRGDGQTYQQMELDYGPFRRQIALGSDVDVDVERAQATYEQGILKIALPLTQHAPAGARVAIEVIRS